MATTDISEYTSAIMSQKKGETVRDAIINAVKVISGSVSAGSRTASTLNGKQLTEFVVNYYNPADNPENKPFAISLNQTKANMKREVDRINYGDPDCEEAIKHAELGPVQPTGVNNNHYDQTSLDRLEVTRREIYEAINEAWRNTPSGAHTDEEYLIIDSDPFEDYPNYISLIGSGEGYALRCSEKTDPITENGSYTADENTGWTKITVNVTDKNIRPHTETIAADGTYVASNYGKDGFSFVNVQVPVVSPDDPSYDPSNPYDQTAWYNGGGQEDGCTVIFYRYEGEKALKTVHVNYGEDAVYDFTTDGTVMSKEPDEYFAGWDPDPKNVQHNLKCYAKFKKHKHVEISTGEITDTWEQIASNHGAPYNVGDWKTLDFGTVTIPLDDDAVGRINIGKVIMVKIAGADSNKGTNSTWTCLNLLNFPTDFRLSWRRETKRNMFFKGIQTPLHDDTGYREPVIYSYQDTDLYNFLNGSSANSIFSNLPALLVSSIKTVSKKSKGVKYVLKATEEKHSSAYGGYDYYETPGEVVEDVIVDIPNKIWIPSVGEIFEKKTNFYTNGAYNILNKYSGSLTIASLYLDALCCNDDNYNDFFFRGVDPADERNWMNYTDDLGTNTEYAYPWKSSSSVDKGTKVKGVNVLLRDVAVFAPKYVDGECISVDDIKSIYKGDEVSDRPFLTYVQIQNQPQQLSYNWRIEYRTTQYASYMFPGYRRWSSQSYWYPYVAINGLETAGSGHSSSVTNATAYSRDSITEIPSTISPRLRIGFCL